ncbi:response regulator, partial [Pseudomonas syringae]
MLSEIQAKLLIVDDLPENLLALDALIKREDRIVFKALSADEALSLLLQHEFALAILDVQMPGMNGFELAEMMRST